MEKIKQLIKKIPLSKILLFVFLNIVWVSAFLLITNILTTTILPPLPEEPPANNYFRSFFFIAQYIYASTLFPLYFAIIIKEKDILKYLKKTTLYSLIGILSTIGLMVVLIWVNCLGPTPDIGCDSEPFSSTAWYTFTLILNLISTVIIAPLISLPLYALKEILPEKLQLTSEKKKVILILFFLLLSTPSLISQIKAAKSITYTDYDTAKYEKYVNKKYGFSFLYPTITTETKKFWFTTEDPTGEIYNRGQYEVALINLHQSNEPESILGIMVKPKSGMTLPQPNSAVNNIPATKIVETKNNKIINYQIIFEKDNYIFQINGYGDLENDVPTFDNVINSFKFTN